MNVGDIVMNTITKREGTVVNVDGHCIYVRFEFDPPGVVQIFINGKNLVKIRQAIGGTE
jgi:hypothetical protein